MRIGVDVTCWANGRGFGRFARELLRAMVPLAPEDEFVCFGDRLAFEAFALAAPNVRRVEVPQRASPTEAASVTGHRSSRDMFRLTRAVWREAPDVFFFPAVYTFFPLSPAQRAVVTFHDAIVDRFPELTIPSRPALWRWRLKVALARRQARLVLTVSDYAADQVVAVFRIPRHRVRVALEAPAASYRPPDSREVTAARDRLELPAGARWFTYVGGFSPHKRLDTVVRAYAEVACARADPPYLLLIGQEKDAFLSMRDALHASVRQSGVAHLVRWPGYLPDEELRALHGGAVAGLLVSESEGFGLPAVETAACGTPVIATTESPLPRLLEGGGVFVRPGDTAALAAAMCRLLEDEPGRAAMGRTALGRARALSWRLGAQAALEALREAAA